MNAAEIQRLAVELREAMFPGAIRVPFDTLPQSVRIAWLRTARRAEYILTQGAQTGAQTPPFESLTGLAGEAEVMLRYLCTDVNLVMQSERRDAAEQRAWLARLTKFKTAVLLVFPGRGGR